MSKKEITDRKAERMEREEINRFEEERDMERRDHYQRAVMNMAYADPLHIPDEHIPPGMEYRWIRQSCLDAPDTKRTVEARRRGWTPVPASRHPDMVFKDFFGRANYLDSFISHSGLVLCERPRELGEIEEEKLNKRNYEDLINMPATDNYMGEPTIPVKNSSSVYMTKATKSSSFG